MTDLKSAAPIPGANPALAIKRCLVNTFKYSGRASRSEYWWAAALATAITAIPVSRDFKKTFAENKRLREEALARGEEEPKPQETKFSAVTWATIAVLTPSLVSLEARRLHDANHSAAWMFFSPINTILCLKKSKPEGARFDR